MMLVIDTNVLFAASSVRDVTHMSALAFLSSNKAELHAPELLKVELMSLLIRSFDIAVAELYFKELTSNVTFHENTSTDVLIEYIKHKKTRGCDTYFAYLADHLGAQLVSFDKDLVSKAGGLLLKTPIDLIS